MKDYLHHTKSFRKKLDGSQVSSLFLGNNRQHMPVCAKIISFGEKKVIQIAEVHISLGAVQGAVTYATLVVGVSLVSIP